MFVIYLQSTTELTLYHILVVFILLKINTILFLILILKSSIENQESSKDYLKIKRLNFQELRADCHKIFRFLGAKF